MYQQLPGGAGSSGPAATAAAGGDCGGGGGGAELRLAPGASCVVRAECTFPAVRVSDVYMDGVAKHVVWDALGIAELNAELAAQ
eukprot:77967-Chlamydomonas_euryale.AAC.1